MNFIELNSRLIPDAVELYLAMLNLNSKLHHELIDVYLDPEKIEKTLVSVLESNEDLFLLGIKKSVPIGFGQAIMMDENRTWLVQSLYFIDAQATFSNFRKMENEISSRLQKKGVRYLQSNAMQGYEEIDKFWNSLGYTLFEQFRQKIL